MRKTVFLIYGLVCYVVFFLTFLYAIGFVGSVLVPKSIDAGGQFPAAQALAVNVLLLGLFAVQHSVMARQGFKRHWTKLIPKPIERSTYVLVSSLVLILLFVEWRPLPGVVWSFEGPGAAILTAFFWLGWILVLISTFLIDHFDLFGLRQVYLHATRREYTPLSFKTTGLYKWIRHPIMLGFIIAFWAAPRMTWGHFLFAVATTAYILIGIGLEEGDLSAFLGEPYKAYKRRAPMLFPFSFGRKSANQGVQ